MFLRVRNKLRAYHLSIKTIKNLFGYMYHGAFQNNQSIDSLLKSMASH